MKGFNIRKLATIAAGAALVGSAVAPIAAAALTDLTKSDVVNADGTPAVDIVVGSHAQVSDVVWAGNIAAKLAQLATKTTAVTGGSGTGSATVDNISVQLAVGGTSTVSGGKTFQSDMNSASAASAETAFSDQNVTNSNIPSLVNYSSKSYTWNNTSYSATMQEKLNFTAKAYFDSVTAKTLVTKIGSGQLKYIADYGSGVPAVESPGSNAAFIDDKNDNVVVPFFGKNYLLKQSSASSGYVELVETSGEKDYKDGDKIEGLTDSNGNSYYIKVGPGGLDGSTNKIKLEVFDSADTKLDGGYYSTGDVTFYKDGQAFLTTSVNISAILKASVSQSDVYTATIFVGTSRLQLYNSKDYPYDPTAVQGTGDYTTSLVFNSDNNYLKRIEIVNSSNKVWSGSTALKVGDSAAWPNNVGTLKAVGLQLPGSTGVSRTERTTVAKIGATLSTGLQGIVYKDSSYEATHELPFAINVGEYTSTNTGKTFNIDSKSFYAYLVFSDNATATATLVIRKDSNSGDVVQTMNFTGFDSSTAANRLVTMTGASDVSMEYRALLSRSTDSVFLWMTLDGQAFTTQYSKTITFNGTDTGEDGAIGAAPDATFYVPHTPEFANGLARDYNAMTYNANNYSVARFRIDEDGTGGASKDDLNVFVDTGTGKLIALPNSQLSTYGYEVAYAEDTLDGTTTDHSNYVLSENTAQVYPKEGYTDVGTKMVLADHVLTVTIPENRPKFEILASGTGTVTTTTGGEELTIAKGSTGSTTAGTTIEVKDVTYTATCGAGSGACTPASYEAIVPVGTLVYTDDSPPTGKVIIVGGHLVNALAQGITDDKLAAAGDKVAEKQANGDIVVAGYTAADTGAAAQELIDALDAMQ